MKLTRRIQAWVMAAAAVISLLSGAVPAAYAAENTQAEAAGLADGVYYASVDAMKFGGGGYSMGNAALRGSSSNSENYKPTLIVEGGRGTVLLEFSPLATLGTTGFLAELKSSDPTKVAHPAVLSEYRNTDGSVYCDFNNKEGGDAEGVVYPHLMAVDVGPVPADGKTPENLSSMPIYTVFVPTMGPKGGNGSQQLQLRVDYSNAEVMNDFSINAGYWLYKAVSAKQGVASTADYQALKNQAAGIKASLSNTVISMTYNENTGTLVKEMQQFTTAELQDMCQKLQTAYEKTIDSGTLSDNLEQAKKDAAAQLDAFRDPADYDQAEREEMASLIAGGKTQIEAAENSFAVSKILADTKAAIMALPNSLQKLQNAAVEELESYKDPLDYLEKEQSELADLIEKGTAEIRSAESADEITAALNAAKASIDKLTTKEEYNSIASKKDKDAAKAELDQYKDASMYREAQREELEAAIQAGKAAIGKATFLKDVRQAVEDAKAAMDAVKTDAQLKREEKEEALRKAASLEDGIYEVQIEMIRADDRSRYSMSNEAVDHTMYLEVKEGKYSGIISFSGLTISGQKGYLKQMRYFKEGYVYDDEYGMPEGMVSDVQVLTAVRSSDGSAFIDYYNDDDDNGIADFLYPARARIPLVDKGTREYVPLQVFVPVMEAISEGTGTQSVLMKVDWTTLKDSSEEAIGLAKPDRTALAGALNDARVLSVDDYTAESWRAESAAVTLAESVLNDESATQYGIDGAVLALMNAQAGLKKAVIDLSGANVKIAKAVYTGKALEPAVTVELEGKTLKQNTDYTVAYRNNIRAGEKAEAVITGTGGYTGDTVRIFTIDKAVNPMALKTSIKTVKAAKVKKKSQSVLGAITFKKKAEGTVTYKKVAKGSSSKLTVNAKNGKITVKKGTKTGKYKIKVTVKAAGNSNYQAACGNVTVTVKVR